MTDAMVPYDVIGLYNLRILRLFCLIVLLAGTSKLQTQEMPQVRQSLSENAEKITLKFPKTYWFNKYKIGLGNFGTALVKNGFESTNQNGSKTKSKQNFQIIVISKDRDSVMIVGKKEKFIEFAPQGQTAMDWALSVFTEIESETVPAITSTSEILEVSITDLNIKERPWNLYLLKSGDSMEDIYGFLENGERKIDMRIAKYAQEENNQGIDRTLNFSYRLEMVENGKCRAAYSAISERVISLEPGLDAHSRSILLAANIVLSAKNAFWMY